MNPSAPAAPPPPTDEASTAFTQHFHNINIWDNQGFVSLAGMVRGGQHLHSDVDGGPGAPLPADAVERREGDISAEQTAAAMSGFAEPDWFGEALEKARSRVVFLVGAPGSGRRTAALNLLQRHTGSFALRAIDSDVELATWTVGETGARGYLIDGLLEPRTLALTSIALDNLRRQLDRAEACLVIVIRQTPQVLAHLKGVLHVDPVRATPPPARAVLDAKLITALPAPERREPVLAALPAGFLDETLQREPGPSQVVELVSEIVRIADGTTEAAAIGRHLSLHAADRAPQLLRSVRDSPDDLALLLATCVFEHFDHTVVEEEARRLLEVAAGRLDAAPPEAAPATPVENPGFVFLRSRRERLAAIEADRGPREVRAASTHSYAVEPVAFTRHLQGRAVLDLVWREHRDAGALLVQWLQQTSSAHRPRADRAGFILGRLAQWSSGDGALAPIEQLASSSRPGDWRMAARAFGSASADPVLATAVKNRLRGWSRAASESLRCTAALTCATEFGLARPEVALALLHTTVTARDDGSDAVESAVRRALLSLFAEPALRPRVVDALVQWSRPAGAARRTACAAVAQLLKTAATVREAGEWWSAHLLSGDAPPGTELIRSALMEPTSFDNARAALLEWQRRAATDPRRGPAVERLMEALAPHLRGGVLRLFTDFERAVPAPGAERASLALAQWRGTGTPQRGHA
ncbi:hypothetical protein FGW37_27690 [Streptomyces rectiverticillatus]|uniref:hypothetical protein n=1 Tax=Streptomyces rectiverticillatus TaxID=173860 RepID=UPI0015C3A7E0|nr:hypothetical protein [Streptomyces rectiverticillatus]QLE74873.1 hypothetical protein FGW37_27690 [Streptomyces rectiverticillatus]